MFVARNHKGALCNALEEKIEKGLISSAPLVQGSRFKREGYAAAFCAYSARRVVFTRGK